MFTPPLAFSSQSDRPQPQIQKHFSLSLVRTITYHQTTDASYVYKMYQPPRIHALPAPLLPLDKLKVVVENPIAWDRFKSHFEFLLRFFNPASFEFAVTPYQGYGAYRCDVADMSSISLSSVELQFTNCFPEWTLARAAFLALETNPKIKLVYDLSLPQTGQTAYGYLLEDLRGTDYATCWRPALEKSVVEKRLGEGRRGRGDCRDGESKYVGVGRIERVVYLGEDEGYCSRLRVSFVLFFSLARSVFLVGFSPDPRLLRSTLFLASYPLSEGQEAARRRSFAAETGGSSGRSMPRRVVLTFTDFFFLTAPLTHGLSMFLSLMTYTSCLLRASFSPYLLHPASAFKRTISLNLDASPSLSLSLFPSQTPPPQSISLSIIASFHLNRSSSPL